MRLAVVGHRTWFENHYPEGWAEDPSVLALDVFEGDYSWLMVLRNWRPDLTLFYRPELYPSRYLHHIPGRRVAFLSEPLPALRDGALAATEESALRLAVYRGMDWGAYHDRLYYDAGRRATAEHLGWPVTGYRPLPLDTAQFHPGEPGEDRPVDLCFVGKATPHRIAMLDFLRLSRMRFLWVAHGVAGAELAALFRRSRVVLNLHADGVPAQEPRLYLAAACGCRVVTEPLSTAPAAFRDRIVALPGPWNEARLRAEVEASRSQGWSARDEAARLSLGVRRMLAEVTGLPVPPAPIAAPGGETAFPRLLG